MTSPITLTNATFGTGKFGQALTGGYGSAAALSPQSAFTISAWVKTTASGSLTMIAGQTGANAGLFWLGVGGDGLPVAHYGFGSNETALQSPSGHAVNDGNWHRIDLVFGPSGGRVLVDGSVTVANSMTLAASGAGYDGSFGLQIGSFGNPAGYFFNGAIDALAVFSTERYTSNYSPETSAFTGHETGITRLYQFDGDGSDSASTPVSAPTIARTDAGFFYSPETWNDDGQSANANSTGSYFATMFTGTSLGLNTVPLAAGLSAYPVIRVFIDSLPHIDVTLSAGVSLTPVASGLAAGSHTLKVALVTSNDTDNFWTLVNGFKFTGLTLDAGASVSGPTLRSRRMLWWGDSISMGRLLDGVTFADVTRTAAWTISEAFDAEVGLMGYSAQGYSNAGSAGVPSLLNAWNLKSSGVPRPFTTAVDYIVDWHGTNGSPVQSDVTTMVANYRSVYPNAVIFMVVPPSGSIRDLKTTAVANAKAAGDAKIFLIDAGDAYAVGMVRATFGVPSEQASDGLHPYDRTVARLAANYASQMRDAIEPRRFTITA